MADGISIVIPVLNEADELPGLIESLCPFASEAEIVFVDGGSVDASAAIIRAAGYRLVTGSPSQSARSLSSNGARYTSQAMLRRRASSSDRRRFGGGLLMGMGGTLAAGCNVGNALTGLSVLAVNSVIATAAISVGGALAVRIGSSGSCMQGPSTCGTLGANRGSCATEEAQR